MKMFPQSLNAKILLLVSFLVTMTCAVLIGLAIYWQYSEMTDQLGEGLNRTSALLMGSIEGPMIRGDDAATQKEMAVVAKKFPDTGLFLTDYRGNVTYSTDPQMIRKDFMTRYRDPELGKIALQAIVAPREINTWVRMDGRDLFLRTVSIMNRPSCYHCHGSSRKILGAMIFVRDMSTQLHTIREHSVKIILVCLVGIFLLVVLLTWFIRHGVTSRITAMAASSDAVTEGDFSARFLDPSPDEVGVLSRNLGKMVDVLKKQLGFSRGILDGMTVPCYVVDIEENISFVNMATLELLGLTGDPEDYVGTSLAVLLHEDPDHPTVVGTVMRERRVIEKQPMDIFDRHGRELYCFVDAAPLYDLEAQRIGAFAIITDLTELRAHQKKIEEQNQMIAVIARDAHGISESVARAAEALSDQVTHASRGAEEQRNRVDEMVTALEQMNATVMEIARNTSHASATAHQTKEQAQTGMQDVNQALDAILMVRTRVQQMRTHMDALDAQSQKIGTIIGVIDGIADQTNLLALNAAIEAARAGDAGRGFAVVADEVRKLAEKTMAATKDVASVVHGIQNSTRTSLDEMDQAGREVEKTAWLGKRAGSSLEEIVTLIDVSADQTRAIATASEEQSVSSEQIARSASEVSGIASETARVMKESAGAVNSLSQLASDLNAIITRMRS